MPLGSVLGPSTYSHYARPIGNSIRNSEIKFHLFSDDCQLCLSANPGCTTSQIEPLCHLRNYILEMSDWMLKNKLKLNDDIIEFLIFRSGV